MSTTDATPSFFDLVMSQRAQRELEDLAIAGQDERAGPR